MFKIRHSVSLTPKHKVRVYVHLLKTARTVKEHCNRELFSCKNNLKICGQLYKKMSSQYGKNKKISMKQVLKYFHNLLKMNPLRKFQKALEFHIVKQNLLKQDNFIEEKEKKSIAISDAKMVLPIPDINLKNVIFNCKIIVDR